MAGWRHILTSFYPWCLWVGLYFYIIGIDYPVPSFKAALLKILPILTLAFLVLATKLKDDAHGPHRRWILAGLLFSAIGDVFMVWINTLMMYGGLAFAAAHLCYISGFRPKENSPVALVLSVLMFGGLSAWLVQHIPSPEEKLGISLYLFLLCMMIWRSLAVFFNELTFSATCGCLGAYIFIASDMIIFIDKYAFKVDKANMWIMITYYIAQLGIAFSVALYKLEFVDPVEGSPRRKKYKRARYTSK